MTSTRLGLALVATLSLSCYPGGPSTVSETDAVVTVFDSNADFASKRTYAMPDFVVETDGSEDTSDEFDELMLSTVAANMAKLGYSRVFPGQDNQIPDVVMLITKTRRRFTSVSYLCWGGGWGGWGGWGWWWPGWGGGWGCSFPNVQSYETGTVLIDMSDPADFDGESLPSIWLGALNGYVSGSSASSASRIRNGIDQAFSQSSYLKTR